MAMNRRTMFRGLAGSAIGLGVVTVGGAAFALRKSPQDVIYDLTVELFGEREADIPAQRAFAESYSSAYGAQLSPTDRRMTFVACDLFRGNPKMLNQLKLHHLASRVWRMPYSVTQAFHLQTTFFWRDGDEPLEFEPRDPDQLYYCNNPFATFDEDD